MSSIAPWEQARRAAVQAALNAWEQIAPLYESGSHIEEKPEGPATDADRLADRLIGEELRNSFPPEDYGYMTEESEDDPIRLERDRVWVIDPIDGTRDFIKKSGEFAIHIALVEKDASGLWHPVAAVVFRPIGGLMFSAVKGVGCSLQEFDGGKPTGEPRALKVSGRSALHEMKAVISQSHRSPMLARLVDFMGFADATSIGSVGLKVSLIAVGERDVYLMPERGKCREWDACAPHLILTEAGGAFTDLDGNPITYNRESSSLRNGLLASNGANHAGLAARIAEFEAREESGSR